jgi:hypothetical protein
MTKLKYIFRMNKISILITANPMANIKYENVEQLQF